MGKLSARYVYTGFASCDESTARLTPSRWRQWCVVSCVDYYNSILASALSTAWAGQRHGELELSLLMAFLTASLASSWMVHTVQTHYHSTTHWSPTRSYNHAASRHQLWFSMSIAASLVLQLLRCFCYVTALYKPTFTLITYSLITTVKSRVFCCHLICKNSYWQLIKTHRILFQCSRYYIILAYTALRKLSHKYKCSLFIVVFRQSPEKRTLKCL